MCGRSSCGLVPGEVAGVVQAAHVSGGEPAARHEAPGVAQAGEEGGDQAAHGVGSGLVGRWVTPING